jgi:hypothetical protein
VTASATLTSDETTPCGGGGGCRGVRNVGMNTLSLAAIRLRNSTFDPWLNRDKAVDLPRLRLVLWEVVTRRSARDFSMTCRRDKTCCWPARSVFTLRFGASRVVKPINPTQIVRAVRNREEIKERTRETLLCKKNKEANYIPTFQNTYRGCSIDG